MPILSTARGALQISYKNAKIADAGNWYSEALVGSGGQVLNNHANALLALRRVPAWEGVLGYDEMRGQVVLRRPVPIAGKSAAPSYLAPIPWADLHDGQAQEWLQIEGLPQVSREVVTNAILLRARENSFHPLRDYLSRLEWDGLCRIRGETTAEGQIIPSFLEHYFGANQSDASARYLGEVGAMVFKSAVARIFEPGCKVDSMLILEGAQGTGKPEAASHCLP